MSLIVLPNDVCYFFFFLSYQKDTHNQHVIYEYRTMILAIDFFILDCITLPSQLSKHWIIEQEVGKKGTDNKNAFVTATQMQMSEYKRVYLQKLAQLVRKSLQSEYFNWSKTILKTIFQNECLKTCKTNRKRLEIVEKPYSHLIFLTTCFA